MDRTQIVGILNFMADLFDLESDNPFRSRSYRSGARALEALTGDLKELVDSGELTGVKGIGESIAAVIADLLETGTTARREELLEAIPQGVREMLSIPGLGSRTSTPWSRPAGKGSLPLSKASLRSQKRRFSRVSITCSLWPVFF